MTRLLLDVTFPRCPECGVLAVKAWPWHHRPTCRITTDPDTWRTE